MQYLGSAVSVSVLFITLFFLRGTNALVIHQTSSITAEEGDTIIMNCTLSHETLGPVRWYKGDNLKTLLYSQLSDKHDVRVSRTVHAGQLRDIDFSITFKYIRLEDAGKYYCVKFKSDKVTMAAIGPGTQLNVRRTKGPTIHQAPSLTGTEGDTVIMNCTVSHESLGHVRWYKGDNLQKLLYSQLLSDKSDERVSRIVHEGQQRDLDFSITFTNITLEDAGMYYCVKFKSDGVTLAAAGSGTQLCVNGTKGQMKMPIYQPPSVTGTEGDTVIMSCTVSHESLGPIRWYKGDNLQNLLYSQLLSDKSDVRVRRIVDEGQERDVDFSITFTNITRKDAGMYYCVKFKSDKVTVASVGPGTRLYVNGTYRLEVYQAPSVTGIEGDTVIMSCTVSSETLGPVRWSKVDNLKKLLHSQILGDESDAQEVRMTHVRQERDIDFSITITNITLEDTGMYYCVKFKADKVTAVASGSGTQLYVIRTNALVIHQTSSITAEERDTIIMNCTLSHETLGPVRWYKGGNLKNLLYSQLSDNPDTRISRTVHKGQLRDIDFSITFTSIRLEDAGMYYCVKFKSDKVTVAATGPGTQLFVRRRYGLIYQTPSLTSKEGDTVTMNCTMSHESVGIVRWYKGDNLQKLLYSQLSEKSDVRVSKAVYEGQEKNNDFSISFTNITLEDAGVYYCVKFKSDKVTVAASGPGTRLYVSSGYELMIYQTPAVTGTEGDTVIMDCTLSQEAAGPVRWYKGGNLQKFLYSEISNDKSDARVSKNVQKGPTSNTNYSITFTNITLEDAGVYYCVKFKSDHITMAASGSGTRLYVNWGYKLTVYQIPAVTGVEGGTAILHCTLPEGTVGPVRWYKGDNLQKLVYSQLRSDKSDARISPLVHDGLARDTDHSITFTDITLEDSGVYYCVKFKSDKVTVAASGSGTRLYISSSIPP